MNNMSVTDIALLLEKANSQGIVISKDEDDLKVAFRKGTSIDAALFQDIKNNRDAIVAYFSALQKDAGNGINEINSQCTITEFEGKFYYDITPVQYYWVNEEKDKDYKEADAAHGIIEMIYKVSGEFHPALFKQSMQVVLQRHESLRATFHNINGKYRMRVEDGLSPLYQTELMDVGNLATEGNTMAEDIISCKDRTISLKQGPLFISRITRVSDTEYFILIRMHHVISDTWSNEVLLRDLLSVYNDLSAGRPAVLTGLQYQFKEFMAMYNNYRAAHYEKQKNYWKTLYATVPGKLLLPGLEGKEPESAKPGIKKYTHIFIEQEVRSRLNVLAREFSTTLFVILQAGFKTYLYHKTGQPDILIGTMVLGRDIPESHDQIGSYARTDLIRTVFNENDTFGDAIRKVKGSNAELAKYRAFTLTDAILEMMPSAHGFSDFWQVNMLYSDNSIFHTSNNAHYDSMVNDLQLNITPVPKTGNNLIPIPLIIDILNRKEQLVLEAQYNGFVYDETTITAMFREFISYLRLVITDINIPFKKGAKLQKADFNWEWAWVY